MPWKITGLVHHRDKNQVDRKTGYGYIQYKQGSDGEVKKVKTFTEKPQLELAKAFFESGDFVWNAGIFIWKTSTIIKQFEMFLPEISETFDSISEKYYTDEEKAKNCMGLRKNQIYFYRLWSDGESRERVCGARGIWVVGPGVVEFAA